ncbi:hypothetical protein RFX60_14010, partial [Acinetobacter sp. 11520]|nr:hypothetical protein [Acinetobacter sp. 11520]
SRYCQLESKKAAVLLGYAAHQPEEMVENIKRLAMSIKK